MYVLTEDDVLRICLIHNKVKKVVRYTRFLAQFNTHLPHVNVFRAHLGTLGEKFGGLTLGVHHIIHTDYEEPVISLPEPNTIPNVQLYVGLEVGRDPGKRVDVDCSNIKFLDDYLEYVGRRCVEENLITEDTLKMDLVLSTKTFSTAGR